MQKTAKEKVIELWGEVETIFDVSEDIVDIYSDDALTALSNYLTAVKELKELLRG